MTATAEPSPVGAHFDDYDPDSAGRPVLPSAAEHYAAMCGHLAEAETPGTPIAEVHRFVELAAGRARAGHLAVAIWPGHSSLAEDAASPSEAAEPEETFQRPPSRDAWAATGGV